MEQLTVAQMATALIVLHPQSTPGFIGRLQTYRDAGLNLEHITKSMDMLAVKAAIRFRLDEAPRLPISG
jgi:hypothetical protein